MFKNVSVFPRSNYKEFIHVPYADKEDAKAHGAYYDAAEKCWYIPTGKEHKNYDYLKSKYGTKPPPRTKTFLNVPYDDKDDAKAHGARYDKDFKSWFTWDNNEHVNYLLEKYGEEFNY